jgi:hypothetical protein
MKSKTKKENVSQIPIQLGVAISDASLIQAIKKVHKYSYKIRHKYIVFEQ